MGKKLSQLSKNGLIGSLLLVVFFVLPVLSLAGHRDKLYVDTSASGTQDGSANHPYKTISEALKKANRDAEVHILAGTYKENIEIPDGVEIFGSDRDNVIIKAKNDNEPAIKMGHKTRVDNITARDGKYGIQIGKNNRVSITNCIIKDNNKDGINIKGDSTADNKKVTISESEIKDNGRAGIFSEKRRLVIVDNEINNNDSDGADLAGGSKVWLSGNRIKNNDGSGLKMVLDKSEIWTKNNTYRENKREGIEVNAYGEPGKININKSKFTDNGRYGIAKVQRGVFPVAIWSGCAVIDNNEFFGNAVGKTSPAIKPTN